MSFIKYRVREVAADFGMTPKEVSEVAGKYFDKPKSNSQVLTDEQLNVIFDHITQNRQIDSLEQVFAAAKKPEPKPAKESPKAAAPVKSSPAVKAAAPAPKSEIKPEAKPEPKPDPSPEPGNTGLTNPGSDDWRTILVSAKYPLAEEMEMERETVGWPVDARIAQPLKDFLAAAKADGYTLQVISGYRTFARSAVLLENEVQAQMKYNGYSREKAEQVAATRVAPPGTSEHNTGLAVDILSGDYYNHHSQIEESFEYDAEAAWMKAHCAEYGFILRYPKDKQDVTGIIFEPWHFRYVGVEIATYIMQNGLTLEEYLGVA